MAEIPEPTPDIDVWAVYDAGDQAGLFTTEALATAYADRRREAARRDGWDASWIEVGRVRANGTLPPERNPQADEAHSPSLATAERVLAAMETLPGVNDDREERQQRTDRLRRITFNPKVCHGKPTIRGLPVTAASVLELLASGISVEEVLADHPDLDRDDILGVLEYAAVRAQADGPGVG